MTTGDARDDPSIRRSPPDSPLRRARKRAGLSQAAAIYRFQQAVTDLGEHAPSFASLKRMFAYWESGERAVGVDAYQLAFMTIYQAPAEVLGFGVGSTDPESADSGNDLSTRDDVATSKQLSLQGVELLRQSLDEVLDAGTPSIARVDGWEQLALRYGKATRDRPAVLLLGDLTDDLTQLGRAMERCHSATALRRLTHVAAQMSGLIVLTLVKLDERPAFRRWARTARVAAAEAGDPTLQAWVLAQEAYGHYYGGDLSEAVVVAQQAQEVAAGRVAVGPPLAAALEARAFAAMGLREETQAAIGRAGELIAGLDDAARVPSAFGYNEAQLSFHEGNAYTHLHDSRAALAAQERALQLCVPGDYTDWAMVRLDRASCLAYDGDAALAVTEISETLSRLTPEQRRGIIDLRAHEVVSSLPPRQRALPAVREVQDLLHIAQPREDRSP